MLCLRIYITYMGSAVRSSKQEMEMNTVTAADFRVESIQKATLNGRQVKLFTASLKQGDAFVHYGKFSAPVKTANRDLWKIAADKALIA